MGIKRYIVEMGPLSNRGGKPHPLTVYEPVYAVSEEAAKCLVDADFLLTTESRLRYRHVTPGNRRIMMGFRPIAAVEVD